VLLSWQGHLNNRFLCCTFCTAASISWVVFRFLIDGLKAKAVQDCRSTLLIWHHACMFSTPPFVLRMLWANLVFLSALQHQPKANNCVSLGNCC
jgi:hypothetical protein